MKDGITPLTLWRYSDVGHTQDARKETKELFDDQAFFDYPKPVSLINRILRLSTTENDLILDFFSGSSTTAHAVMQLNAEDGGNRKYIMVQLPEVCDEKSEAYKAGYKTIADIGKERIRRAANKIKLEKPDYQGDLGFKVFKLDSSNFKIWNSGLNSEAEYHKQLDLHVEKIKSNGSREDILYEIILSLGLPLSIGIAIIELGDKQVFSLQEGKLLICLEDKITEELIESTAELNPDRVIFLDQAFQGRDLLKINALHYFKNYRTYNNQSKEIEFITI